MFGAGSRGGALTNGRAAALAYARAGAAVAVVDVDAEAAQCTVDGITAEGGSALALAADVTDEDSVAAVVDAAVEALGTPSVLHNNVGVTVLGAVDSLSTADWERGLALNATGAFLTCRNTLPHMAAGRGARGDRERVLAGRGAPHRLPLPGLHGGQGRSTS
ncbi:SDR family NAD(P)-dependent oxidoreductase [Pseudonocardia oroxyli]|uniref:Short chain dehydrogenase n=1 Tax=Pseudonocardia oroxyli TaxID=366584 RepID=A0A1G7XU37_PSEOR|nr:SDR family NAD(P)-dependent oxidoreductase [Pseudonocardia oroxyli]SDG87644.1 short chain dehydrogenase [Pseudonocardia oroxyli]